MSNNIDRHMSRLNERLMACSQSALDSINYLLDDMNSIAEQNFEREDIRACINEVKTKTKKALTESWAIANHWSEHFDGLGREDSDSKEESESTEKQEGVTDVDDEVEQ